MSQEQQIISKIESIISQPSHFGCQCRHCAPKQDGSIVYECDVCGYEGRAFLLACDCEGVYSEEWGRVVFCEPGARPWCDHGAPACPICFDGEVVALQEVVKTIRNLLWAYHKGPLTLGDALAKGWDNIQYREGQP